MEGGSPATDEERRDVERRTSQMSEELRELIPSLWIRVGIPLAVADGLWYGQQWAWWTAVAKPAAPQRLDAAVFAHAATRFASRERGRVLPDAPFRARVFTNSSEQTRAALLAGLDVAPREIHIPAPPRARFA